MCFRIAKCNSVLPLPTPTDLLSSSSQSRGYLFTIWQFENFKNKTEITKIAKGRCSIYHQFSISESWALWFESRLKSVNRLLRWRSRMPEASESRESNVVEASGPRLVIFSLLSQSKMANSFMLLGAITF